MSDLKKSVADGKTLLINALSVYETNWSATWNSETAAWGNIRDMINITSTNRYNTGYSTGRAQGQADIINSPNSYSLYTATQYSSYGTSQYNAGVAAKQQNLQASNGISLGHVSYSGTASVNYEFNTQVTGKCVISIVAAHGNADETMELTNFSSSVTSNGAAVGVACKFQEAYHYGLMYEFNVNQGYHIEINASLARSTHSDSQTITVLGLFVS